MKENAATAEVNQILAKEQTTLQKENHKLQLSVEEERSHKEKRRAQISDVIKKVVMLGWVSSHLQRYIVLDQDQDQCIAGAYSGYLRNGWCMLGLFVFP